MARPNFNKPFFMSDFNQDDSGPGPGLGPQSMRNMGPGRPRYDNAFGNYRGGYGPGGGFGPGNYGPGDGEFGPNDMFGPDMGPDDGDFGPVGGFGPIGEFSSRGRGFGPRGNGFGPPRGLPPRNFGPRGGSFGPRNFDNSGPNFGGFGGNQGFRDHGFDQVRHYGSGWIGGAGGGRGPEGGNNKMRDKKMKFLLRCGVAKENLKGVPNELLRMMEEDHCGLCSMSFETFAITRMHYASKNHLKKQKKWIQDSAERSSQYAGYNKNNPFRARELYCELCDVQITSKVHGDSHYSGKSHKAIVEGRRLAKNPALLQPENRIRLEQLIRREKKHLKTDDGEEVEEDKDEKDEASGKPLAPELYCNICKTSVTCTEQMTAHLNGKRHLAKEKHTILLKMMIKTDNANAAKKDKPTAMEDDEQYEGNEDDEGGEYAQDDDKMENKGNGAGYGGETRAEGQGREHQAGPEDESWVHGSGNWEEQDKTQEAQPAGQEQGDEAFGRKVIPSWNININIIPSEKKNGDAE